MSIYHYYIIEIDLPVVTGACTINGAGGYSTPLTCTDQADPVTEIKTYKFTDSALILRESDIYLAVDRVAETTPRLKAGNGLASRATCNITFDDFINDPNEDSPAVLADQSILKRGTFFGKLKARNILANKAIRVKYYKRDGATDSLVTTNNYIITDIKRGGNNTWVLTSKDVLDKADDEKAQFPKVITGRLSGDLTVGSTSLTMEADINDWSPFAGYIAVIGKDLLVITNASGTTTSVTLTVVRPASFTLGSRLIINTPAAHITGDEVLRGRVFQNSSIYNVLQAIFLDVGIKTSEYDGAGMQIELNSWLGNISNSIDCIFYEAVEATKVLNQLCATFMIDMWTDTKEGKVKLKATSPWNTTSAYLREDFEIIYDTVSIEEPRELHYSRAFMQYDKRALTLNDDDGNYTRSSFAINTDLEGPKFYDEEKVKRISKSLILSNRQNNVESADLTVTRYAQRFSNRPQKIIFEVDEADLSFELADVVEILANENQDFTGNPKQGVRAQVTQITPMYKEGRRYKVSTVTYNPFVGGVTGQDLIVNSTSDINLFTLAGGPPTADTYNFILDGQAFGQDQLSQAITAGSFPSGSILNLVCINGAIIVGKAGDGGNGGRGATQGTAGGLALKGTAGTTVNVYLNGNTGDLGNGSYSADGYLYAPSGGGGGGNTFNGGSGGGGGGGAGFFNGTGGTGGASGSDGETGTNTTPGAGGAAQNTGGNGGVLGSAGDGANSTRLQGGAAGSAINLNSGTVNVLTSGQTSRFIKGAGDNPSAIS